MRALMMMMTLVFLSLALSALACGDDESAPPGECSGHHCGDDGACGKVENCMDTVDLEEGLAIEGEDGKFTLTVDAHNRLAPEDNEWEVTLTDAAGDPVASAELTADVWSVDCMHVGPVEPDELTTDADGKATLHPIAAHGGPWDVIVKVKAGTASDAITLHLCITGEEHPGSGHHEEEPDAG